MCFNSVIYNTVIVIGSRIVMHLELEEWTSRSAGCYSPVLFEGDIHLYIHE